MEIQLAVLAFRASRPFGLEQRQRLGAAGLFERAQSLASVSAS
jgi:hypothetical protein